MPVTQGISQPLSKLLTPLARTPKNLSSADLLTFHGFVRQVGSGIYDVLPLGLRVQSKIESIIRKHLNNVDCTELVLSTLVNPSLWQASGRLGENASSQEFTFVEGKKALLAPTGEEQITTLVGSVSYRQLPLSLYQISRKFRNELRPRGGLLRTREFVMKDLYTFDSSAEQAAESYERIRGAYFKIFEELGVPFTIADADSGDMGGDLSHEYHYLCQSGEDTVVTCSNSACDYSANLEKAMSKGPSVSSSVVVDNATIPEGRILSLPLVRMALKSGAKLVDWRLDSEGAPLVIPEHGENCAKCGSHLELKKGIEVGHTFYLGDRYSDPLKAKVSLASGENVSIQMGCYGIGVTRIVAAIAEKLKDENGLVWPLSIAPYTAYVVSKDIDMSRAISDELASQGIEAVYEDRTTQVGHGMRYARESGIPYTVVLSRSWESERLVEILPRLGKSLKVPMSELASTIKTLTQQANNA